jgi:hypothetical protein
MHVSRGSDLKEGEFPSPFCHLDEWMLVFPFDIRVSIAVLLKLDCLLFPSLAVRAMQRLVPPVNSFLWLGEQWELARRLPFCLATLLGTHNSAITMADGYGNLDAYFQQFFSLISWVVRAFGFYPQLVIMQAVVQGLTFLLTFKLRYFDSRNYIEPS